MTHDTPAFRKNPLDNLRTRAGNLAGFTPSGKFIDNEGRAWEFETLVLETEALYRVQPQNDFYDNLLKVARFLWKDNPQGEVLWWTRHEKETKLIEARIRQWTSRARKKAQAQGSDTPVIWTELVSLLPVTRDRTLSNGQVAKFVPALRITRRKLNALVDGEQEDSWRDEDDLLATRPVGRPKGSVTKQQKESKTP